MDHLHVARKKNVLVKFCDHTPYQDRDCGTHHYALPRGVFIYQYMVWQLVIKYTQISYLPTAVLQPLERQEDEKMAYPPG